jgi:hypothetical protein
MSSVFKLKLGRVFLKNQPEPVGGSRIGLITIGKDALSLREWCAVRGLKLSTVKARVRNGLSPEEALSFPRYGRRKATAKVKAASARARAQEQVALQRAGSKYAAQMLAKNIERWQSTGNKHHLASAQGWIKTLLER